MKDSWQSRTYQRLRDRGWYRVGDLFEAIKTEIPLHLAMRATMNASRGLTELPDGTTARWRKFLICLSHIGVETSGNPHSFKWQDVVRLRYVDGRACEDCGGPVIKRSWATGRCTVDRAPQVACLACEAAAEVPQTIFEEALQEIVMPPPQPPPGDRIGEAVAYAVLHKLIAQWGPPMRYHLRRPSQPGEARAPPQVIHYWPVKERGPSSLRVNRR